MLMIVQAALLLNALRMAASQIFVGTVLVDVHVLAMVLVVVLPVAPQAQVAL